MAVRALFVIGVCLFLSLQALTQSVEEPADRQDSVYQVVKITKRSDDMVGIASSASQGATGAGNLAQRPIQRTAEALETVPGLIITQHSGDGKANQYFLRGHNLDHGTDLRVTLDHMQVNMPTHGHGQGYADLNFLIPELINSVEYRKGPYYADLGDFASAGSTEITYKNELDAPMVKLTGGSYGFGRVLTAASRELNKGHLLGALEVGHHDGPWTRPNAARRYNGVLRWSNGDLLRGHSLTLMGYDASWLASDQIPQRAVDSGQLDPYDLIDPDLGGSSGRFSLTLAGQMTDERHQKKWSVSLAHYDLSLFSNFTYFLDDVNRGDEFQQTDRRWISYIDFQDQNNTPWHGLTLENQWGFQIRADQIDNGLYRTENRQRIGTTRQDEVFQTLAGVYGQTHVAWNKWFRSVFGLRSDHYYADVESRRKINSGRKNDWIMSPKLSLIWGTSKRNELYLNMGYGFHSNDARGTTIGVDPASGDAVSGAAPLVRTKGADLGFSSSAIRGLVSTVSLFVLDMDSELVFVGDAGGTEAGRPSRRSGLEWTNHWHLSSQWSLDADFTFSRARFRDHNPEGDRIPGSVERTVSSGLAYRGHGNWQAALRLRHYGGIALIEDGSVKGEDSNQINGRMRYVFANGLALQLDVLNALDADGPDIQYYYRSRLGGEPAEGVEDIHFHPMEKRSLRLTLDWRF